MKKSGFQVLLDTLAILAVGSTIIESAVMTAVINNSDKKIRKATIHEYLLVLQKHGYITLVEGLVTIIKTINIAFNEYRSSKITRQQDTSEDA